MSRRRWATVKSFHKQATKHARLCTKFPTNTAPSDSQQLIYRNVQPEQVTEGCDELKCYDRPCDQSCDHEEEEEPLMKTNNYQFCWDRPWRPAKPFGSWTSNGTAGSVAVPRAHHDRRTVAAISYGFFDLFCLVLLLFASVCQTEKLLQQECDHKDTWRQITQASKATLP